MAKNNQKVDTLLYYNVSPHTIAFSTTRISPNVTSPEAIKSMGNYAAFNVTHYCGDNPQRVDCNRTWLCNELGISKSQLWLPRQTHTDNICCIDNNMLSLTDEEQQKRLQNVDALITNIPQQCIGVSTADCVPVLVYDEEKKVIASIHAGWRGTEKKITLKTIQKMVQKYGTNPTKCKAIIGPSISVDAFEVGEEVVTAFQKANFPDSIVMRTSSRPHIDLWAANAFLIEQAGIPLEQIQIAGICTYNHSDTFFSARKLGIKSGRIYTAIMLK